MLHRKVREVFQLLLDTNWKDRIVDCFLVDIHFANEDFITKAIKCLTSFINKDLSAKPWYRHIHFKSFIVPKTNALLSYKDHRFNQLFLSCMAFVFHIDDVAFYLDTRDGSISSEGRYFDIFQTFQYRFKSIWIVSKSCNSLRVAENC